LQFVLQLAAHLVKQEPNHDQAGGDTKQPAIPYSILFSASAMKRYGQASSFMTKFKEAEAVLR